MNLTPGRPSTPPQITHHQNATPHPDHATHRPNPNPNPTPQSSAKWQRTTPTPANPFPWTKIPTNHTPPPAPTPAADSNAAPPKAAAHPPEPAAPTSTADPDPAHMKAPNTQFPRQSTDSRKCLLNVSAPTEMSNPERAPDAVPPKVVVSLEKRPSRDALADGHPVFTPDPNAVALVHDVDSRRRLPKDPAQPLVPNPEPDPDAAPCKEEGGAEKRLSRSATPGGDRSITRASTPRDGFQQEPDVSGAQRKSTVRLDKHLPPGRFADGSRPRTAGSEHSSPQPNTRGDGGIVRAPASTDALSRESNSGVGRLDSAVRLENQPARNGIADGIRALPPDMSVPTSWPNVGGDRTTTSAFMPAGVVSGELRPPAARPKSAVRLAKEPSVCGVVEGSRALTADHVVLARVPNVGGDQWVVSASMPAPAWSGVAAALGNGVRHRLGLVFGAARELCGGMCWAAVGLGWLAFQNWIGLSRVLSRVLIWGPGVLAAAWNRTAEVLRRDRPGSGCDCGAESCADPSYECLLRVIDSGW